MEVKEFKCKEREGERGREGRRRKESSLVACPCFADPKKPKTTHKERMSEFGVR
jgi:hypothetical protein